MNSFILVDFPFNDDANIDVSYLVIKILLDYSCESIFLSSCSFEGY